MDRPGTALAYPGSSSMRVLVLTRIFPNAEEPLSSPFNRQQFAALAARCDVELIAPVPWFPGSRIFGQRLRAGRLSRLPSRTRIDGIEVRHPRALYLPIIGASIAVPLYSASVERIVESYRGRCDVLLASWLYPDACSALQLAPRLGVPCVVKAHGSDVQQIARRLDVAPIVRALLPRAYAAFAPSKPLVRALVSLGSPEAYSYHLPNGVDREIFGPRERLLARKELGLSRNDRLVVFVGRLTREKGISELMRAFSMLEDVKLALIGDGPMRSGLDSKALAEGRLIAPGAQPLPKVATWMAAADVVTLPSWSEGTPNVVLEALSMGRPVVASKVGGIPDILCDGETGFLVPPRNESALADYLHIALNRSWAPEAISARGPISWDESAAMLESVLHEAVSRHRRQSHAAA